VSLWIAIATSTNISHTYSSSYFHIRSLRHIRPFLNIDISSNITCAISQFQNRQLVIQFFDSICHSFILPLLLHNCAGFQHNSMFITNNYFEYSCPPSTPQCRPSVLSLVTSSALHAPPRNLRSDLLYILSQPRINTTRGFRYAGQSL